MRRCLPSPDAWIEPVYGTNLTSLARSVAIRTRRRNAAAISAARYRRLGIEPQGAPHHPAPSLPRFVVVRVSKGVAQVARIPLIGLPVPISEPMPERDAFILARTLIRIGYTYEGDQ